MELELKHLIDAYKYQDDIYGASDIWKIVKISYSYITLYNGKDYNEVYFNHFHLDYSILKRPLSDLTKEIEVNGEKFVPLKIIKTMYPADTFSSITNIARWSHRVVEKLYEWHFAIDIPQHLYVDINTI